MKLILFITLLSTLSVVLSIPLRPGAAVGSKPLSLLGRPYHSNRSLPTAIPKDDIADILKGEERFDRVDRFQSRMEKKLPARMVGQEWLSYDGHYPAPPSPPSVSPAAVPAVPNTSVTLKSEPVSQATNHVQSHIKAIKKKSAGRQGGKRRN
ncbi:hypothetical protein Moror_2073 [Moniliophthora roreri MCA 2997]|uniref:Uncharacterized protein n=2 Tax=Moniliophthora roreri TaxID=221103 RepID=V2WU86_MONRO|nr:hypothetical protein Moror_2073 [Moniliophthora roreri MCA 2997]